MSRVHSPQGTPGSGPSTRYVRQAQPVDVTVNGADRKAGQVEAIDFESMTASDCARSAPSRRFEREEFVVASVGDEDRPIDDGGVPEIRVFALVAPDDLAALHVDGVQRPPGNRARSSATGTEFA